MTNFPFQRLQADLAALIEKTPPGQRLLSEPQLAQKMGVSRATLREAMRTFETQGLIRRRQGSGTYVVGKVLALDSGLEVLESIETIAGRLGLSISFSDLKIEQTSADERLASMLNVARGSRLRRVQRVIHAEGRPVAYLVDVLPEEILRLDELDEEFRGSVLDLLLRRGETLTTSRADVSAVGASPDVAKALQIQRGDVLLHFSAQLFNAAGRIVDYSLSYFIPGYFHFHIVRRVGK